MGNQQGFNQPGQSYAQPGFNQGYAQPGFNQPGQGYAQPGYNQGFNQGGYQ